MSPFCVGQLPLSTRLTLDVVDVLTVPPWKQTNVPSLRSCQSQWFLGYGWDLVLLLFFQSRRLSGLNLCRSSACCHSVSEFIFVSPVVPEKMLFTKSYSPLLLLKIFPPSFLHFCVLSNARNYRTMAARE